MGYVVRISIQFLLLFLINRHKYIKNLYMPINLFSQPILPSPFTLRGTPGPPLYAQSFSHLLSFALWWLCHQCLACLLDFWPVPVWFPGAGRFRICLISSSRVLLALWCAVLLDSCLPVADSPFNQNSAGVGFLALNLTTYLDISIMVCNSGINA